jgi:hypothetical protein
MILHNINLISQYFLLYERFMNYRSDALCDVEKTLRLVCLVFTIGYGCSRGAWSLAVVVVVGSVGG